MLSTPAPSDGGGGECSPLTAVAETKRDFDVTCANSTATTQTTVIRTRDSGADTAPQGCKAIHTQKETARSTAKTGVATQPRLLALALRSDQQRLSRLSLLFPSFSQTKFVPHFESVSSKMRPEADQRIKASTADGQAGRGPGVLHSVDSLLNDCERLIIYLLSSVPLCSLALSITSAEIDD